MRYFVIDIEEGKVESIGRSIKNAVSQDDFFAREKLLYRLWKEHRMHRNYERVKEEIIKTVEKRTESKKRERHLKRRISVNARGWV